MMSNNDNGAVPVKGSLLFNMWKKFQDKDKDKEKTSDPAKAVQTTQTAQAVQAVQAVLKKSNQLVERIPFQWREVIDTTRNWTEAQRKSRGIISPKEVIEGHAASSNEEAAAFNETTSLLDLLGAAADEQERREELVQGGVLPQPQIPQPPSTAAEQAEEPEEEEEQLPVNSRIELKTTSDKIVAWIKIHSPVNGGQEIDLKDIEVALEQAGIVHGVLKQRIREIVKYRLYDRRYQVAIGERAFEGTDGKVQDHFPRNREIKFAMRTDGTLDFKTRNIITNIPANTLICELIGVVPPVPGKNVMGQELNGKAGKAAMLPKGDGTKVVENQLLSDCEGDILYVDGKFKVQKVYEVHGDVDNTIGNIDFSGDVVVKGDVREGYIIKAKGSVVVMGMVEGASIIADGGITIQKGMNGMNKGIIRTQKGLTSKYLENCVVYAKGDVVSESIIYSTIYCDGDLRAEGKHGALIGGNLTVYRSIKAKTVGSPNNAPTIITLGITPELMSERGSLIRDLKMLQEQRKTIDMDVQYLAQLMQRKGTLPPEKTAHIQRLKMQDPINRKRLEQVHKRMEELEVKFSQVEKSFLVCNNIYPGVQINIGNATCTVSSPAVSCRYALSDGEISYSSKA